MSPEDQLQAEVASLKWHHRMDLGNGVVTPGLSQGTPGLVETFPDFRGQRVLDIGAWDGKYSFLAESSGAKEVVALDHYVWGVDMDARSRHWDECRAAGTLPDHNRDETEFWRADLPGKRPFDLAHRTLDSRVSVVVGDFMTVDLEELGTFDIVLYLGVLYHMQEPLTALKRVRKVTNAVAVIETEALLTDHLEHEPLLKFNAGQEVTSDYGNWYVPNAAGLDTLCRAAGFSHTRVTVGAPAPEQRTGRVARRMRSRPKQLTSFYRTVVHAYP
jgi:tRNA (mo5U34)-methyltransferase